MREYGSLQQLSGRILRLFLFARQMHPVDTDRNLFPIGVRFCSSVTDLCDARVQASKLVFGVVKPHSVPPLPI